MKKIRVTINEQSCEKTLMLFSHSEAAYVWFVDTDGDINLDEGSYGSERIKFNFGDTAEIEWLGCEYSEDDVRIDMIRLIKAKTEIGKEKLLVSIHYGWTCNSPFPYYYHSDEEMTVYRLVDDENQFNFQMIFQDEKFLSSDDYNDIN